MHYIIIGLLILLTCIFTKCIKRSQIFVSKPLDKIGHREKPFINYVTHPISGIKIVILWIKDSITNGFIIIIVSFNKKEIIYFNHKQ